jgi:hypothetical protein
MQPECGDVRGGRRGVLATLATVTPIDDDDDADGADARFIVIARLEDVVFEGRARTSSMEE